MAFEDDGVALGATLARYRSKIGELTSRVWSENSNATAFQLLRETAREEDPGCLGLPVG